AARTRRRQHGPRATTVDPKDHPVALADGSTWPYDELVLAAGHTVRKLPIPGADADNVFYLRTVENSDALRETFGKDKKLVIIGGGWIGLETAAAARGADTDVTLLEGAKLPLYKILGDEVAQVFADLHRDNGVDLRTNVKVSEIVTENGRAVGVRLEDGTTIDADNVAIGVG